MGRHIIPLHPLDGEDINIEIKHFIGTREMTPDEKRHVGECDAMHITDSSTTEKCAYVLAELLVGHADQINDQIHDVNAGHHYSNPFELIAKETQKKEHKKITHTGNIATAHQKLKELDSKIVSEETPKQMAKWIFWCTLIGAALLALAVYSVSTEGAKRLINWVVDSTWFMLIFLLLVIGFSLYFRFVSGGLLVIGVTMLLGWIAKSVPWLGSFIINGVLFLAAAILLFTSVSYILSIVKYKPLPEQKHLENQAYIAQRDALRKELNEYSELMLNKISVIRHKFTSDNKVFCDEFCSLVHSDGPANYDYSIISGFIGFIEKYYRKMRR